MVRMRLLLHATERKGQAAGSETWEAVAGLTARGGGSTRASRRASRRSHGSAARRASRAGRCRQVLRSERGSAAHLNDLDFTSTTWILPGNVNV